MAFELVLKGQGSLQEMVIVAPGEGDNESKGQEGDTSWHVQRSTRGQSSWGSGPTIGAMEDKARRKVKGRICHVCQSKKPVLYSGDKLLKNECDLLRALPGEHGEDGLAGARMRRRP